MGYVVFAYSYKICKHKSEIYGLQMNIDDEYINRMYVMTKNKHLTLTLYQIDCFNIILDLQI